MVYDNAHQIITDGLWLWHTTENPGTTGLIDIAKNFLVVTNIYKM